MLETRMDTGFVVVLCDVLMSEMVARATLIIAPQRRRKPLNNTIPINASFLAVCGTSAHALIRKPLQLYIITIICNPTRAQTRINTGPTTKTHNQGRNWTHDQPSDQREPRQSGESGITRMIPILIFKINNPLKSKG